MQNCKSQEQWITIYINHIIELCARYNSMSVKRIVQKWLLPSKMFLFGWNSPRTGSFLLTLESSVMRERSKILPVVQMRKRALLCFMILLCFAYLVFLFFILFFLISYLFTFFSKDSPEHSISLKAVIGTC